MGASWPLEQAATGWRALELQAHGERRTGRPEERAQRADLESPPERPLGRASLVRAGRP
mgnify:CR=1 FL=1